MRFVTFVVFMTILAVGIVLADAGIKKKAGEIGHHIKKPGKETGKDIKVRAKDVGR
jgi:hypothetical protein